MKKTVNTLYFQVLLAILVGVVIGHFFPAAAVKLKPLGDAFIRLIKMMIPLVIFCTIVIGIAGMQDLKKIGRVGLKAVLYFEVVSTFALVLGLLVVNLLQPGKGMNADLAKLDTTKLAQVVQTAPHDNIPEFLMHIIPENIVDALAHGNLLQVLFFSILFGVALSRIGPKAQPVLKGITSLSEGLFSVIKIIMRIAPIGAFGAMAFTIGQYGIGSLASLAKLMGSFYLTCLLFIFVVLGLIMRLCGFSLLKLLRLMKAELLIVLGTSSSEPALPGLMDKLEKAGCSKSVVGLVVPTGYSFNLDGTAIYLTMAAVFLAQATSTPMDLRHQLSLLLVLLITSKGAAGVTGSGFITLAATLPVVGHIPVVALALILGIDRFMSEARALTNHIGNAVATVAIAKWEKEIDPIIAADCLGIQAPKKIGLPARKTYR
jgi:aerobic C4-dicarboxylate transport protein